MRYSIYNVCTATTLWFTELKLLTPDKYNDGEWSAIADVLETLISVSEMADEENEKE